MFSWTKLSIMFVLFFLGTHVEVPWCKGIVQLTFFQKFWCYFFFNMGHVTESETESETESVTESETESETESRQSQNGLFDTS